MVFVGPSYKYYGIMHHTAFIALVIHLFPSRLQTNLGSIYCLILRTLRTIIQVSKIIPFCISQWYLYVVHSNPVS